MTTPESWRCGCGELNNAARKDCGNCGASVAHPYDPIFQREMYPPQNVKEPMTTPEPSTLSEQELKALEEYTWSLACCVCDGPDSDGNHDDDCQAPFWQKVSRAIAQARAARPPGVNDLTSEVATLRERVEELEEDAEAWRALQRHNEGVDRETS